MDELARELAPELIRSCKADGRDGLKRYWSFSLGYDGEKSPDNVRVYSNCSWEVIVNYGWGRWGPISGYKPQQSFYKANRDWPFHTWLPLTQAAMRADLEQELRYRVNSG